MKGHEVKRNREKERRGGGGKGEMKIEGEEKRVLEWVLGLRKRRRKE